VETVPQGNRLIFDDIVPEAVEAKKRRAETVGRPSNALKELAVILPPVKGKSREEAGKALGVSGKYVSDAKAIKARSSKSRRRRGRHMARPRPD
jgi:hypothetical protein